jgi:hypothetical protein
VVCALSGARLLRLRCQGNQGNQETTEITEIDRNRQKSTEINRRFCVSCVSCVASRGSVFRFRHGQGFLNHIVVRGCAAL